MSAIEQKEEWLLQRSRGLGGTDIAAIMGLHPYKSPIEVFLGKIGQSEPVDITPAMWWGTYLEDGVAQRYCNATALDLARGAGVAELFPAERCGSFNEQIIVHHAEHPWVLGTPDGIVLSGGQVVRGLEIKTAGFKNENWGKAGTDEVPAWYLLQCCWYMLCTGIPVWDLHALFHGNQDEIYSITRNPELEKQMCEAGRAFWFDHVLKESPPAVDETEAYGRYLARRFSIGNGALIPATPEIDKWATALRNAQRGAKMAEAEAALAKNTLASLLANAGGCQTACGKVAWVRPKGPSTVIDYETAFKELAAYAKSHLEELADSQIASILSNCTTQTTRTPYVRGWFSNGDK